MSAIGLLIVGVVLLILAYYLPMPPGLKTALNIIGWICTAIGGILLIAAVLGLSLATGKLP
jgi:hypothetical protein